MVPSRITVVYSGDARILDPLKVSVFALLRHLDPACVLDLQILEQGWSEEEQERLRNGLEKFSHDHSVSFHTIDVSPYRLLPRFHGSHHCYSLIHIAEYVQASRFLYLDYDTLPLMDVSEIFSTHLNGHACAAVCWNLTASSAQESNFYHGLGLPSETPIFNSGVVLIDRASWLSEEIPEKCMEIAHTQRMGVVGDQTILNAVIRGSFVALPWRCNVRLGAAAPRFDGEGVAHFVGKPKPWDFLGRLRHRNYRLWARWLRAHEDSGSGT